MPMSKEQYESLIRNLADEGKLVEAGWISLSTLAINPDAPEIQLEEMKMAFFAGAQHVFASVIGFLEEGTEPTARDLNRLCLLEAELSNWGKEFKARIATPPKYKN